MKPRVLKGFRDYAPEEMMARQLMLDKVRGVFESFGYMPLHTPALEYSDILLGKYGDEGEKLLYRFLDNGGRDVALRYDLTVPLARFVGMNPTMRMPFRRYQIAPVWRAERPQRGRFREFYQCDADLIGVDSPQADAECILIDCGVMAALGMEEYTIQVNHRGFLDGLLAAQGIGRDQVVPVMRILDKVDKVTRVALKEMLAEQGLVASQIEALVALGDVTGDHAERLRRGLELAPGSEQAKLAIDRMEQVLELVEVSAPGAPVRFTPSVARGLDYYTGIVYETFLPPSYGVGSVMSGGRYNNLLGSMAKREIPAVGISLGIDRLLSALSGGEGERKATVTRVLVCTMPGTEVEAAGVAARLRQELPAGANGVELYPTGAKVKKQFDYANKRGIGFVVMVGEDEASKNMAALKNLETGEQIVVSEAELAARITGSQ
jgi:histidyl-tRNA synthetase